MHTVKPIGAKATGLQQVDTAVAESVDRSADTDRYEHLETHRVGCPDCARPIAMFADERVLPRHALCPTPWDPFGLTVCQGSGRPVAEALPAGSPLVFDEDTAALPTLPQGLDWRTQPFSHAGGPGSRPLRVPRQPQRA